MIPIPRKRDERHADDNAPFSALAFKIATDSFVGRLSFVRVYSGVLNTGTTVLNSTKKQKERIGRILQMHANHREDIECCYAGDIAAVVGLKNSTTGDTLCDEKHPIILESMEFPEPVIRVAIEPKTKAGQEKMGLALVKLAEEDPPLRPTPMRRLVRPSSPAWASCTWRSSWTVCSVSSRWRPMSALPRSPIRRPSRKSVEQDTKYARQSGGKGQYGHVRITVEPNRARQGLRVPQRGSPAA